MLSVDPHPALRHGAFRCLFPRPLGETPSPDWLVELLSLEIEAPLQREDQVRLQIRDLLRHGGYKPTGRGKPSSEYLLRAAQEGGLATINPAVDACNAVSLHSGLPISVIDLDRATEPLRIAQAGADTSYVFNPSGQTIRLDGLLCVFDHDGPCANAVKDAQRTKTDGTTRRTPSIVWACAGLEARLERALLWYRSLLERLGAETEAL